MTKTFTLGLSLLMAGTVMVSAQNSQKQTKLPSAKDLWAVSLPEQRVFTAATRQAQQAELPYVGAAPRRVQNYEPLDSLSMSGYGYLKGPDGTQWFYTSEYTTNSSSFYSQSVITLYDSSNQQVGTVTVDVPDSMRVNDIQPYGSITKKMFDRDDTSYEMLVHIHGVGTAANNYEGTYKTYIYHTTGEKMYEIDGSGMLFSMKKDYTDYQRLLISRYDGVNTYVDVYAPVAYGATEPEVEHTFTMPDSLINYCMGALVNCYSINKKPYYVIAQYENTFDDGVMEDGYYPIQRTDNNFILRAYDEKYRLVDSISTPLVKPESVTYRLADFGFLGTYDFSDGYFTESGKHAFVVTYMDLTTTSSDYVYSFVAYDSNGDTIKTVCDNAVEGQWFYLSPVKGQNDQLAVLQEVDDVQQIKILDMPSCETVVTIPSSINDDAITSTMDRYQNGDSYLYAIKMSTAGSNDAGDVIGRINWYTPELTLDHTTQFNLGANGEYFTPLLNSTTMNPYLFDTDDDLEYVYIAKKKIDGSDALQTVLEVADEDGTVIKTFAGDGTYAVNQPAIFAATDARNQLNVIYRNDDDYTYKVEFYELPFSKFTKGGDGTASNPYLISTAGDMLQIKADTKAYYKLVNNIDMNTDVSYWNPVDNFTGSLDGGGYSVENLYISSSNYRTGLFQSANAGSVIRNITFVNPTVIVNASTGYAAVVAGDAMTCRLDSVHVVGANFVEEGSPYLPVVGGLVGRATVSTQANCCSFSGTMNVPSAVGVGGIYGGSWTTSTATACYAEGTFTGQETVGGIVGQSDLASDIIDCHANVTLAAQNGMGGIVGYNSGRAYVKRCRAEGSIMASGPSKTWKKLALGGVAGTLESDWIHGTTIVMENNTVDMNIAKADDVTDDGTAHRIVGMTIANEDYESGQTQYTEVGLANNYATSATLVCGNTVTSDDATSVEGATKEAADMGKDFYTGLGYAYGTDVTAPWKGEYGAPVLYFEDAPKAIVLADNSLRMEVGGVLETTATVYGSTAEDMTCISADAAVATAEIVKTEGNTVTIRVSGITKGETNVSLAIGGAKAECNVTVIDEESAISRVVVNDMVIRLSNGVITADGAAKIAAYGLNGQLARCAAGGQLNVSGLTKGVYVVVAMTADGSSKTAKVVIK